MGNRICNGCSGVIGRDCFNPIECEWITQQMEQDEYDRQSMERQAQQEMEREHQQEIERYEQERKFPPLKHKEER